MVRSGRSFKVCCLTYLLFYCFSALFFYFCYFFLLFLIFFILIFSYFVIPFMFFILPFFSFFLFFLTFAFYFLCFPVIAFNLNASSKKKTSTFFARLQIVASSILKYLKTQFCRTIQFASKLSGSGRLIIVLLRRRTACSIACWLCL